MDCSELSTERYNLYSDSTMDGLLNALENLVDSAGNPAYEVEYHVGGNSCFYTYVAYSSPERRLDASVGGQGHLRDK